MREAGWAHPRPPRDEGEHRVTLETRKPTAKPSWPLTLVTGVAGSGKSWLGAEASASPLISRTLWIGYGELDPDDYGSIDGADFDIVAHDGTTRDVVAKINEIADMPTPDDGRPVLIVVDSGGRFWDVLYDGVQRAKSARGPRAENDSDNDLWTPAHDEWQALLGALRRHNGPSIITARFAYSAVYVGGKANGEMAWRVQAEKGLPYDVDAVIEMRSRGDYTLSKVKSARMELPEPRSWPDFTIDALWREMGLADTEAGPRTFAKPVTNPNAALDRSGRNWNLELKACHSAAQVRALGAEASTARATDDVTVAIRRKLATLTPATPTQ